ncbi:hypothetical protein C5S39_03705 [Candidatus Methanophagaceae archaeon]|nr:hypothetical protein C5S39_03705 [Methanophagales archaeon]
MPCIIIKSFIYCVYVIKKRVVVISGSVVTRDKKDGGGFVHGTGYILCKLSKKGE